MRGRGFRITFPLPLTPVAGGNPYRDSCGQDAESGQTTDDQPSVNVNARNG
jgi:hypothetical protein